MIADTQLVWGRATALDTARFEPALTITTEGGDEALLPLSRLTEIWPVFDARVRKSKDRVAFLLEAGAALIEAAVPIMVATSASGVATRPARLWHLADPISGDTLAFAEAGPSGVFQSHVVKHWLEDRVLPAMLKRYVLPAPFQAEVLLQTERVYRRLRSSLAVEGVPASAWAAIEAYIGVSVALWASPAPGDVRVRVRRGPVTSAGLLGELRGMAAQRESHLDVGENAVGIERPARLAEPPKPALMSWARTSRPGWLLWRTTYARRGDAKSLLSEADALARLEGVTVSTESHQP